MSERVRPAHTLIGLGRRAWFRYFAIQGDEHHDCIDNEWQSVLAAFATLPVSCPTNSLLCRTYPLPLLPTEQTTKCAATSGAASSRAGVGGFDRVFRGGGRRKSPVCTYTCLVWGGGIHPYCVMLYKGTDTTHALCL